MKSVTPRPAHLAYRRALEEAMRAHGATLQAEELLAITAHLVGQLIALQDQRTISPAMALDLVGKNIERGNLEVVDGLLQAPGGHA